MDTNQEKISVELHTFLSEWLFWAENGAKSHPAFRRHTGLCCSLVLYILAEVRELVPALGKNLPDLSQELDLLLKRSRDTESTKYPFGKLAYDYHAATNTQHLDENRLAWVRDIVTNRG